MTDLFAYQGVSLPSNTYEGFECRANTFIFREDIRVISIRNLCAALFKLVEKNLYEEIILDFTLTTYLHYPVLLALLSRIEYYKRNWKTVFQLSLPIDQSSERLFLNAGWAHFIVPDMYEMRSTSGLRHHLPTMKFFDIESVTYAVDEIVDLTLKKIERLERGHLQAFEWALNEIADNVVTHSDSAVGGFIHAHIDTQRRMASFCAVDAGLGIPRTLRDAIPEYSNDVVALENSIKEGVTRNKDTNRGNGLYGSYQLAIVSHGYFNIESGNAKLEYSNKNGLRVKSEKTPFKGTHIQCTIDLSKPDLLSKALKFKNKPYEITYDYIDKKYPSDPENNVSYVMRDHCKSFRLRAQGTLMHNELLNLVTYSNANKVVVDFSDISVISSSFADEVFGKLVKKIGFMETIQKLDFRNVNSTVKELVERAFQQRFVDQE